MASSLYYLHQARAAERVMVGTVDWTEMYVPYNLETGTSNYTDAESFAESFLDYDSNTNDYTFDDPLRQHLHLFQNPTSTPDTPTPVFLYAHPRGGKAEDLRRSLATIAATGYSAISWESISFNNDLRNIQTCWADFELVWVWFQENAASYNLDPNVVVVGGWSRGTMCSWITAHSANKPAIQGIYMYDALPDGLWSPGAKHGATTYWEEAVTVHSPPAHLLFGQECPKPILQDCVPSPNPSDTHNPRNGQTIVDRYTALGIGSRIRLTDGLHHQGLDPFYRFPEFVASLSEGPQRTSHWKLFLGVAFCLVGAVVAYHKYHKKKRCDRTQNQEPALEDGPIESYRDHAECDKLVVDDSALSLQDMDDTSYQDEPDHLPKSTNRIHYD